MTKQEEIREGIKKRFVMAGLSYEMAEISAKSVMRDLDSQGVVIKVDKELPEYKPSTDYQEGVGAMLVAGYVAVEPLIKGGE